MNSFSKLFLILILIMCAQNVHAVNLNALYTAACEREIGIMLQVTRQEIKFLTIQGRLITIKPYDVVYWTYYPMERFPFAGDVDAHEVDRVRVKTRNGHDIVDLVEGWPIGYTADKISFLTTQGLETIIDRRSIWKVERVHTDEPVKFTSAVKIPDYEFVHPYVFRDCSVGSSKAIKVYPQQVLTEPVTIKTELDRLRTGHDKVERYQREQNFYGVPQVYVNKTSLGLWHSFGSRHGMSGKRANNFTPLLVDDYSSDVFDYQHRISSGSGPILFGSHEEPQTHTYYHFKSSYFHFLGMFDPNLILVGKDYSWQSYDIVTADARSNDVTLVELGFDYDHFALQIYAADIIQFGVRLPDEFVSDSLNVPRIGLKYHGLLFITEASYGSNSRRVNESYRHSIELTRFNFSTDLVKYWNITYSFLIRRLNVSKTADFTSTSYTNAVYGDYKLNQKLQLQTYIGAEFQKIMIGKPGQGDFNDETLYWKGGLGLSLSF